jgi:hypothetical protein
VAIVLGERRKGCEHACTLPPARSLVSRRIAFALILGLLITVFTIAPAAAHGATSQSIKPLVPECTYTHWTAFKSAGPGGYSGYQVYTYAEGKYDNTDYAFCGYIRGHLSVYIPAYHVGGSASISIAGTINYGSAGIAGSSGYWYNLYTGQVNTQCGAAGGTFTPSGGSAIIVNTSNACA